MSSKNIVDMWLDDFGAYQEDSLAADYYRAVEASAAPIITVVNELPHLLRTWVKGLTVGTSDRPLSNIFVKGKVLNFNYIEFVEKLYGVPKVNVCYIHGCRVKEKGKRSAPLILGHMPGASDFSFKLQKTSKKAFAGMEECAYRNGARERHRLHI